MCVIGIKFSLCALSVQARLTEELASSTARVSELQLELTAQRQKSAGLQTSLSAALQEGQQHSERISALESQLQGEHSSFYC